MSDLVSVAPPVSGLLASLGFGPDHPLMKTAVPVALRGNNLVVAAPPAPGHALPAVAAALVRPGMAHPMILVAPEASVGAWVEATGALARAAGRRAVAGPTPTRTAHHLGQGTPDLVVTTGWVLGELLRQSALTPARIGGLVLVWPELELSDEAFVPLFAELPKETQRIILTADPAAIEPLVERYAWRAPVVGPLGSPALVAAPAARRLRTVTVGWDRRVAALGELVDLLDRTEVTVWTAESGSHEAITALLAGHGVTPAFVNQGVPPKGFVIFFDAPPPELLGQVAADDAVLIAPAETELYFRRWVDHPAPIADTGPLDLARRAVTTEREAIRARIEAGLDRSSLLTVAPLLERYSPATVAIALHSLWTRARVAPPPAEAPAPRAPSGPSRPKVWLGIGRKDGVTIGEMLALVTLEGGVSRAALGRLELKETFTLVECDSEMTAHDLIEKLAGKTVKNRRVSARMDRGRRP